MKHTERFLASKRRLSWLRDALFYANYWRRRYAFMADQEAKGFIVGMPYFVASKYSAVSAGLERSAP